MNAAKEQIVRLLRWSERYTKTDMVYLVENGSWLSASQLVSALASFLLAIAFANLLPKEAYGTYKYILSVTGVLTICSLPKMNTAIARAVARGFEGSLQKNTKERIRWSLLGTLPATGIAIYYFLNDNQTLAIAMLIVAAFLPFFETFTAWNAYLYGRRDFKNNTIYTIVIHLVSFFALFAGLVITKNVLFLILIYFISYTTLRIFFFFYTLKKYPPNTAIDEDISPYGKHLTAMAVLGVLAMHLDKIFLFQYFGALEVASYSIAMALPEQIRGMLKNINSIVFPKFALRSLDEIRQNIYARFWQFGLIVLVITTIYVIAAPILFEIFFPLYSESVMLSQIFALSIITVLNGPIITALEAKRNTKELYIFQIASPVVGIALFFAFVPFFGILGAVLAQVGLNYFRLGAAIFLLNRAAAQSTKPPLS